MMISTNYKYFNATEPEPMQIDSTDYYDTSEHMEVDAIFADNDTDTEPMDVEISSKKRRFSDISAEEGDDEQLIDLCPPPLKKKERSVRKAKKSPRNVMVVPVFVYFVL